MKNTIIIVIILVVAGAAGYFVGSGGESGVAVNGAGLQGTSGGVPPASLQESEELEMISTLKAKIEANPDDADSLAFLGNIYFERREFADAIKYFKLAVGVNPQDVSAYNELGLAHHYNGDSQEALRAVDEGIKVDPYFQRIWLTKGFILAASGKIVEAREAWMKVSAIDPESSVGKAAASFLAQYQD